MVKKRPKPVRLKGEVKKLHEILNGGSDLAVILIATSFIDACLKAVLEKRLAKHEVSDKLLSMQGALNSIVRRADMCLVLGIIPPLWRDLITGLAKIRNRIAHHHLALSFDDGEVKRFCAEIPDTVVTPGDPNRFKFTMWAVLLVDWLLGTAKRTRHAKVRTDPTISFLDFRPAKAT